MSAGIREAIKLIKRLACDAGQCQINGNALQSALDDFGWGPEDICACIQRLKVEHCYKFDQHWKYPDSRVYYFRASSVYQGESVYTHLYIIDYTDQGGSPVLVINSFKELGTQ